MAPKTCVLAALNVAALFAVVSGFENFAPTPNTTMMNLTAGTLCTPPRHTPPRHTPPRSSPRSCPHNALKLAACSGILKEINFSTGMPPRAPCCAIIKGFADFEVAVCVCTALKANIFGLKLDIPISFTKLFNTCRRNVPRGFICK